GGVRTGAGVPHRDDRRGRGTARGHRHPLPGRVPGHLPSGHRLRGARCRREAIGDGGASGGQEPALSCIACGCPCPVARGTGGIRGGPVPAPVREVGPGGDLLSRDDLPEALDGLPGEQPWRVHFHLPLHAAPALPLANTDAELVAAARALLGGERALTDHLEVETYTWNVLPAGRRPTGREALVEGLAAELDHARDHLHALGLEDA